MPLPHLSDTARVAHLEGHPSSSHPGPLLPTHLASNSPLAITQAQAQSIPPTSPHATIQSAVAALKLPKVGYAVAIDLGDAHSPVSPIHPHRKQEVHRM